MLFMPQCLLELTGTGLENLSGYIFQEMSNQFGKVIIVTFQKLLRFVFSLNYIYYDFRDNSKERNLPKFILRKHSDMDLSPFLDKK